MFYYLRTYSSAKIDFSAASDILSKVFAFDGFESKNDIIFPQSYTGFLRMKVLHEEITTAIKN